MLFTNPNFEPALLFNEKASCQMHFATSRHNIRNAFKTEMCLLDCTTLMYTFSLNRNLVKNSCSEFNLFYSNWFKYLPEVKVLKIHLLMLICHKGYLPLVLESLTEAISQFD